MSIERETFPAMVRDGGLFARSDDSYWLDTGTPAAFLEANFDYLQQKRGPIVTPVVTDRGDGVLLQGESDLEGTVTGPSVIFSGCVIESGARVERSILGRRDGCLVGCGGVRFGADGRVPCRSRRQGGRLRDGPALHCGPAG